MPQGRTLHNDKRKALKFYIIKIIYEFIILLQLEKHLLEFTWRPVFDSVSSFNIIRWSIYQSGDTPPQKDNKEMATTEDGVGQSG
jgi:hypothetical protein